MSSPSKIPVFCIAIIGKNNNPLYIKNFSSVHHDLKFHYIAHTACDVVEERLNTGVKHGDLYLGLLTSIEDCGVHGYLTNTRVKFLLILPVLESIIKDEDVKGIFARIHVAYTQLCLNPFYDFKGVSFSPATSLAKTGQAGDTPAGSNGGHHDPAVSTIAPISSLSALLQDEDVSLQGVTLDAMATPEVTEHSGEVITSQRFMRLIDLIGGAPVSRPLSRRPKSPNAALRARPLPLLPTEDELDRRTPATPTQPET